VTVTPAFFSRCHAWAAIPAALGLLAGCATPGDAPPPLLREATAQTRAGEEAYLAGRAGDAIPSLAEAARLHLAAGDLPGASRALLNLALAQRAAGDANSAAATATRLRDLTPAALQQENERAARDGGASELSTASAWLDALLAMDRGDLAAADSALSVAGNNFPATSPWPGRVAVLQAEVALKAGRFADALARARAGQAACAAAQDRAEEARAWRFAGAAHRQLGQWTEARVDFLAALKLEETLGGGARMTGDLRQLAAIAEHLGDGGAAQLYTQRAAAIAAARTP